MSRKRFSRRKRRAGQPIEPSERARSSVAATDKSITDREAAVLVREKSAHSRSENADRREEAAERREEAADRRQEAADRRDEAVRVTDTIGARTGAQLREANERLVVATVRAQTMTAAAEEVAAQTSYTVEHDFLTGLPNRSLLMDRLALSIALAQRHGKRVAVMFLDLDHFKHVNDSLGHAIGDQLLQSVAKRLQANVRHSDTVSRHGGDEFVVLLGEVEAVHDAILSAEKLIEGMAAPHLIGGHRLHISMSIGISLYPDDGDDVQTMLRNADTAMYHAKRTGRNNYQAFTPDMNAHAVERRSVENALHLALEQHGLVLHYQPKVDLATGAITGVEALLRLQQADRSLVRPLQFVSIAEDCGLILPIGKWVLREACNQKVTWSQAGLDMGHMAVNVSAVEFHHKDFLTGVRTIIDETGIDPRCLELELTESGLMKETEKTMAILSALKDIGVQIAIDDFGTGYSSLSYLRRFPIDTIKIDQSFVHDIGQDASKAIVSAVIAMGIGLKQRVVAEGIETREQLAFLKSHHCAEGQGYYFSGPMVAEKFTTLLRTMSK